MVRMLSAQPRGGKGESERESDASILVGERFEDGDQGRSSPSLCSSFCLSSSAAAATVAGQFLSPAPAVLPGGKTGETESSFIKSSRLSNNNSRSKVVPPANFGMVCDGLYRMGQPNELNFSFMRRLNVKTIVFLKQVRAFLCYIHRSRLFFPPLTSCRPFLLFFYCFVSLLPLLIFFSPSLLLFLSFLSFPLPHLFRTPPVNTSWTLWRRKAFIW